MYPVDNSTGVAVMPAPDAVFSTTPLWFTRGDSNNQPTYPGPDWMNTIQGEMLNVLAAAGISPKKDDLTQLSQAISAICNSAVTGSGFIKIVNSKTPEADGAITLTAADVGALPDTYTAPVTSVNTKTGAVSLTATDIGALPDTYTAPVSSVNGKAGAVSLTAADVQALPDTYTPPSPDLSGYETKSDANARFVQGVQLGAEVNQGSTNGHSNPYHFPTGNAVTGIHGPNSDINDADWYTKPIQQNINGTWATIAG